MHGNRYVRGILQAVVPDCYAAAVNAVLRQPTSAEAGRAIKNAASPEAA